MDNSNRFVEFGHRVKNLHIEHPQIKEIYRMLDSIKNRPGKTRHLFITGSSNVGKTSMAEKFVEKNPSYVEVDHEGTEIDKKPVLLVEVPHPFTLSEFYYEILDALGAPRLKGRSLVNELKNRVYYLIEKQGVKIIIFDEINNIMSTTNINDKTAMDAIKQLSNKTRVSLVLMGVPESANLRNLDEQYKSRYRPKKLRRFDNCDEEFCKFLVNIEKQIDPPAPLGIGDKDTKIPQLLHYMSKGKVGYLTPLIIEAFSIVGLFDDNFPDSEIPTLKLKVLNEAYEIILGDALDDNLDK